MSKANNPVLWLALVVGLALALAWWLLAAELLRGYDLEQDSAQRQAALLTQMIENHAAGQSIAATMELAREQALQAWRDHARVMVALSGAATIGLLAMSLSLAQLMIKRRAAHAALRIRDRAFAASPNGIIITDPTQPDNPIIYCNAAFERITGYRAEQALGRNCRFLQGPFTRQTALETVREAVEEGRDISVELCNMRRNGDVFWNALHIAPVADEQGRVTQIIGIMQDVTERRHAEEDLRLAKNQAEAANRSKAEFLANMSHELRTPLNAIIGFSEVLTQGHCGPLGAKQREYLDDVRDSARHLLAIIGDILDLSQIEVGRVALRDEALDLAAVLQSCLTLIGPRAAAARLTLTCDLPPGLPRLVADDQRLRQIVMNLLSNAVKFTPAGGRIRLRAEQRPDGGLSLAIADSGIGMSEDEIAVALEPFRQVDGSFSKKYEGTGLGLPLCKSLAELHGADFTVFSRKGEGTTVSLLFPPSRAVAGEAVA